MTKEQRDAAHHPKGPAYVIAGAGTGKTTTLVERVVFLVQERKLACDRILVTTFTRKATAELYGRLQLVLGGAAQRICISTIDAKALDLAQKLSREGLLRHTTLIGEAEQILLLLNSAGAKGLLYQNSYHYEHIWPKIIQLLKSAASDGEVSEEQYADFERNWRFLSEQPSRERLQDSLKDYFATLENRRLVDYPSLTRDVLACLKRKRRKVADFCFDAVVVDEFQDTGREQAELLLALSGKKRNIWVVGDPCQQIYEWRGASPETFKCFAEMTGAKRYRLTGNFRSTQVILDGAHNFLSKTAPKLRRDGFLNKLNSERDRREPVGPRHPIYRRPLERLFPLIRDVLQANPALKPACVTILSRSLTRSAIERIERRAQQCGFRIQVHSTRPTDALEKTLEIPEGNLGEVCWSWRPGQTLKKLYDLPKAKRIIKSALGSRDFVALRELRAMAHVADAVDRTQPSGRGFSFAFHEVFPALRNVQERDIAVTTAVAMKSDHIQVMTIHAAKGLEFPVVAVMTLGKKFPKPKAREDARVAYVGATRARDALILVHAKPAPEGTLRKFESRTVRLAHASGSAATKICAPDGRADPLLVAARHLNLYEQCPLKFAAFHEGRFLEPWTIQESAGKRLHKALEYYLSGDLQRVDDAHLEDCFRRGFEDGDSVARRLPQRSVQLIRKTFSDLAPIISREYREGVAVEERYRYLHQDRGQVEGVVDAVLARKNGSRVLIEWKAASKITKSQSRGYELQVRAGALGLMSARPDLS